MPDDYLPKSATLIQACEWLNAQTRSTWSLARLIESGTMPHFWMDYSTDAPPEIFKGRTSGYLAPMVFANDTSRLEYHGEDALVTMTRTAEGELFTMTPGMRVSLSELRFLRDDIRQLVAATSGAPEKAAPAAITAAPVPRQRFQEAEILRVIAELGYAAKALPKSSPGKRGPKAEVRAKLNMTTGVFDLAWERLRSQNDIQDAR